MRFAPGSRLGAYEILSPLGAGGMGEVWRARDTRLQREVALKILPEAFAQDADRLARFTREAHVLASLNHPNIAAIYSFEEIGRRPLPRPRARQRRDAQAAHRARAGVPERGAALRAPDCRRARGRARQGHPPPRPEARERQGDVRGEGQAPRLRPREGLRARDRLSRRLALADARRRPDAPGRRPRDGQLHEPRAGARPRARRAVATSGRSAASSTRCSRGRRRSTARACRTSSSRSSIASPTGPRCRPSTPRPAARPPAPAASEGPRESARPTCARRARSSRPRPARARRRFSPRPAAPDPSCAAEAAARSSPAGVTVLAVGAALLWLSIHERDGKALPASKLLAILPATDLTGPRGRAAALRRRVVQPRREAPERPEPRDHAALELGDAQGDGRREVGARHGRQPPRPARRPADGRHAPALVLDLGRGLARPDRRGRGVRPGGRAFPARGRADAEARGERSGSTSPRAARCRPRRPRRRRSAHLRRTTSSRSATSSTTTTRTPSRRRSRSSRGSPAARAPRSVQAALGRAYLASYDLTKDVSVRPSRAEGGPASERDRSRTSRRRRSRWDRS